MFSNFALVGRSSGIRPGLSPEDEEVKRKLAKFHPWVSSELIRWDILGPSGLSSSRAPTSRPSLPFVMKTSREEPSVVKPTREELQARVESLAKKKRRVKRRAQAPLESSLGKVAPSPLWSRVFQRASPLDGRDSLFVVLLENHLKKRFGVATYFVLF